MLFQSVLLIILPNHMHHNLRIPRLTLRINLCSHCFFFIMENVHLINPCLLILNKWIKVWYNKFYSCEFSLYAVFAISPHKYLELQFSVFDGIILVKNGYPVGFSFKLEEFP